MSTRTAAILPSHAALAASSLVFSMTLYGLMRGILSIPIPAAWFAGILGVQIIILLLGRTILTPLGGCALSLVAAVAGLGYSIYLIFRAGFALALGGLIAVGVVALAAVLLFLLVLAGATRFRSAPPEEALPSEPLVAVRHDQVVDPGPEIATVLEPVTGPEDGTDGEPLSGDLFEDRPRGTAPVTEGGDQVWTRPEDAGEHEFDFLDAPAPAEGGPAQEPPAAARSFLDDEALRVVEDVFLRAEPRDGVVAALEDIANLEADVEGKEQEPQFQDEDWADLAARDLVGDAQGVPSGGISLADPPGKAPSPSDAPRHEAGEFMSDSEALSMAPVRRPKFRIVSAGTGETLRTFHCDAGYSSLDLAGLNALLTRELHGKEPRIVGLNWFDVDQVEVIVEEAAASPLPEPAPMSPPRVPAQPVQMGPIRYFIYDRKTYTRVGEYAPEGRFPRLDRLTLHRILPQYDFRTFVIEAIRWVGQGEVRIYVRGDEKGKAVQPAVQKPAVGEPVAPRPRRRSPGV